MGETGYARQIRELVRLGIVQHLPYKGRAELGDRIGTVGELVVRILYIKGFDAVEDAEHLSVGQVYL